jgi:preprotein translocase subunit YajC
MHVALTILAATTSTTTKTSHKSSSSTYTLLFIVVIFAAVYLLFIRPRQQRARQQQTAARQLTIGDPVVTAGGIQGRVVALDNDVVEVEVAPGVVLTMLRRAVSLRPDARPATPAPAAEDEWPGPRGLNAAPDDDETPDDKPDEKPDQQA